MNALIRVIQSAQHDIILSRIAALLWCHCWAFNASVIANTSNMACSQKRWALSVGRDALFDFRWVERKEKRNHQFKKKKKVFFSYNFLYLSAGCGGARIVYLLQLFIIIFGILYALQLQQLCRVRGVAEGLSKSLLGILATFEKHKSWPH